MPNFSIKYHYSCGDGDYPAVRHNTAVVRASSVEAAHEKLVRFLTRSGSCVLDEFKIDKTSISSYNLILS